MHDIYIFVHVYQVSYEALYILVQILHKLAPYVTNLDFFVTRRQIYPRQGKNSTSLVKIK